MNLPLIAPSILSADFSLLKFEIQDVQAGGADWIHLDVMDGHFVPNLTIGPVVVHWVRQATPMFLDAHLMISDPLKYVPEFIKAGADSVTFHIESESDPLKVIQMLRDAGKKVGISLRPKTPVEVLRPYLNQIDLVLVMTVEPGFGGQKFMPDMLDKVIFLKNYAQQHRLPYLIQVDGGINAQTAATCVKAGAQVLVAGNAIFAAADRAKAIASIRQSCQIT